MRGPDYPSVVFVDEVQRFVDTGRLDPVHQEEKDVPELTLQQQAALESLQVMAEEAKDRTDVMKCIEGEVMLYSPCDRALIPGHIYSMAGIKEARISGCCEYHFDRWFQEGWVDVLTGEKGHNQPEDEEPDQ